MGGVKIVVRSGAAILGMGRGDEEYGIIRDA